MPKRNRAALDEGFTVEVTFSTTASLHQDYGNGENFVHEIFGKISVRDDETEQEQQAGELRGFLVQFIDGQAHGVSPYVLADAHSHEIFRYYEELFDDDEFKPEIQERWQTEGSDLLVVSSVEILDRFEGQGIRLAALGRMLDLFSRTCDLVACFPELMRESLDREAENADTTLAPTGKPDLNNALALLKNDCLAAGLQAWGDTGLYLLNPTHDHPDVLLE